MICFYYVGRIVERQKKFNLFFDLIKTLNETNLDICFKIFGDGDVELLSNIKSLGNEKTHIEYFGFKTNWVQHISEGAIQIFLSDYEGCPLALLEAYKNNNKFIAVLNSPGLYHYVSNNCIFSNIYEMAAAISQVHDFHNYIDLSEYFNDDRHTKEVNKSFNNIFELS